SSKYDLEEYSHQLAALDNDFDEENQTIDQVEDRLGELSRLKRKYGMELSEILDYFNEISEEVYQIVNRESYLEELKAQLSEAYQSALDKAKRLNDKRQSIAQDLISAIEAELKDLYMENSRFTVRFSEPSIDTALNMVNIAVIVRITRTGFNSVEFYVATKRGVDQRPQLHVASRGESARYKWTW